MKKFLKVALLTVFMLAALVSVAPQAMTVNAAVKNTVSTSVSKIVSKAKGFKVTWKKKSGVKGYQIQYSTSPKFTKSTTKTKTVEGAKKTSLTVSKLKGCNVKYYVRIRTYKISNGKKVYSAWSSTKKVSTLKHSYAAATCTKAKTCKYCEKTTGDKLGHKWSAATCTKAKTCVRCNKTTGKALGHKYSAATCTKAKTCVRCKKTTGKALGHKYSAATCTKAKTCVRCKKTVGKAVGHSWNKATCTTPKTCNTCGTTVGTPKGHNYIGKNCLNCGQEDPRVVAYEKVEAEINTENNRLVAETQKEHNDNLVSLAAAKLEAESEIGVLRSAWLSKVNSLSNQRSALVREKDQALANALINSGGYHNSNYDSLKKQYDSRIVAIDNQIAQTNSMYGNKIAEWENYINNLPTVADYEYLRDLKLRDIENWKNQQIQNAKNYYGIS